MKLASSRKEFVSKHNYKKKLTDIVLVSKNEIEKYVKIAHPDLKGGFSYENNVSSSNAYSNGIQAGKNTNLIRGVNSGSGSSKLLN